jgi:hypothetical protein
MALYEALERVSGISVDRDFAMTDQLPPGPGMTYLHLAAPSSEWRSQPEELINEIERFAVRGGRFVITFYPESAARRPLSTRQQRIGSEEPGQDDDLDGGKEEDGPSPGSKKERRAARNQNRREKGGRRNDERLLKERWGFDITVINLEQGAAGSYEPAQAVNPTDLKLPRTLDWHSGLVFTHLDPSWKTIYQRGSNAVVIERAFGAGSVVAATDSYFVSNEAIFKDRHTDLLGWLIGGGERIIFDEAHLGVVESPGIGGLMRKYRLHGFLAGLLVLTGLFVWKNATSLAPRRLAGDYETHVTGKDATSGLINLLRRNIPSGSILKTCCDEWSKSGAKAGAFSAARKLQAQEAFRSAANENDPPGAYRRICEIIGARIRNP